MYYYYFLDTVTHLTTISNTFTRIPHIVFLAGNLVDWFFHIPVKFVKMVLFLSYRYLYLILQYPKSWETKHVDSKILHIKLNTFKTLFFILLEIEIGEHVSSIVVQLPFSHLSIANRQIQ